MWGKRTGKDQSLRATAAPRWAAEKLDSIIFGGWGFAGLPDLMERRLFFLQGPRRWSALSLTRLEGCLVSWGPSLTVGQARSSPVRIGFRPSMHGRSHCVSGAMATSPCLFRLVSPWKHHPRPASPTVPAPGAGSSRSIELSPAGLYNSWSSSLGDRPVVPRNLPG